MYIIFQSFFSLIPYYLSPKGWDGIEDEKTVTWDFAGGLFYSITVITTIGIILV